MSRYISRLVLLALLLAALPAAPTQAAEWPAPPEIVGKPFGNVHVFAVQGNYAYLGEGNQLTVVDIRDKTRPTRRGSLGSGGPVRLIEAAGRYVYVVSNPGGLQIVDVTNPAAPVAAGGYAYPPATIRGIAAIGPYLYLTIHRDSFTAPDPHAQIVVLDVSNPAAPVRVAGFNTVLRPEKIVIEGTLAYIGMRRADIDPPGEGALLVLDVTNPAQPSKLSGYEAWPGQFTLAGRYLIVPTRTTIDILDRSNPAQLKRVGQLVFVRIDVASIVVNGNYLYVHAYSVVSIDDVTRNLGEIDDPQSLVIDIAQPATPRLLTSNTSSTRFVSLVDGYLYAIEGYSLVILNLVNPAAPRPVGGYSFPFEVEVLAAAEPYVAVAGEGRLLLLDVSNLAAIRPRGSLAIAGSVATSLVLTPGYLYLGTRSAGLRVIDIGNPDTPYEVASYTTSTTTGPLMVEQLVVAGTRLYVATRGDGLLIFDITRPARPRLLGRWAGNPNLTSLASSGQYVYAAALTANNQARALLVLNVANPAQPKLVTSVARERAIEQLFIDQHYAYSTEQNDDYQTNVAVFDLNNPTSPQQVSSLPDTRSYMSPGFAKLGRFGYIGSYVGVFLFDMIDPAHPVAYTSNQGALIEQPVATSWRLYGLSGKNLTILRQPLTVRGQVLDPTNQPVAGVALNASDGSRASTDAAGSYSLPGLPSGSVTITPTLAGFSFSPPQAILNLTSEQVLPAFVVLPAPVSLNLTPGQASTSSYRDIHGLATSFRIPANAVNTPTRLTVTPQLAPSAAGLTFTGHGFVLASTPGGVFRAPLGVTLSYSRANVATISDLGKLALRRWDGSAWVIDPACPAATPQTNLTTRQVTTAVCRPGSYALFGPSNQVWLPQVQ